MLRRMVARTAGIMAAVAACSFVAGCYAPVAAAPAPAPTPTATPVAPYGDGSLVIGSLLPLTGPHAGWAAAQAAGIELAVREINEAGGVAGEPVRVYHRDSGEAGSGAVQVSFGELIDRGVDVVVGPADPALVAELAPLARDARVPVLTLAPARVPAGEGDGFVLDIVAGPGLVGAAAAGLAAGDEVVVVPLDDYGAAVAAALVDARGEERQSAVVDRVVPVQEALRQAATGDAVVIAGSSATGEVAHALVEGLAARGFDLAHVVLASDAPTGAPAAIGAGVAAVRAVVPATAAPEPFATRLRAADPGLVDTAMGAAAYDAVILAALAAVRAGDDGGESVARAIPAVSSDWIPCASYAECVEVLATEDDIDYLGVSGPLDLGAHAQRAGRVAVLGHGEDGAPHVLSESDVSAASM